MKDTFRNKNFPGSSAGLPILISFILWLEKAAYFQQNIFLLFIKQGYSPKKLLYVEISQKMKKMTDKKRKNMVETKKTKAEQKKNKPATKKNKPEQKKSKPEIKKNESEIKKNQPEQRKNRSEEKKNNQEKRKSNIIYFINYSNHIKLLKVTIKRKE